MHRHCTVRVCLVPLVKQIHVSTILLLCVASGISPASSSCHAVPAIPTATSTYNQPAFAHDTCCLEPWCPNQQLSPHSRSLPLSRAEIRPCLCCSVNYVHTVQYTPPSNHGRAVQLCKSVEVEMSRMAHNPHVEPVRNRTEKTSAGARRNIRLRLAPQGAQYRNVHTFSTGIFA